MRFMGEKLGQKGWVWVTGVKINQIETTISYVGLFMYFFPFGNALNQEKSS